MLEALLHKKLTYQQENMEDILTSNVFGMLQYVPPREGLFPFLARAKMAEADGSYCYPLQNLVGGQEKVNYRFWPEWRALEPTGARRIQPDVALHIQGDNGKSYLVAIEAKFHSGKSSVADEADTESDKEGDGVAGQVEAEAVSAECTDQLVRVWIALRDEAAVLTTNPVLIYLTAGLSYPKEQIRASLDEYRAKRPDSQKPVICWLSWRELADMFSTAPERSILRAIVAMVEQMGLTFFRGISKVPPVRATWQFKAVPQQWRFQVSPIRFCWSFSSPEACALPRTRRFRAEPAAGAGRVGQTASDWSFRVSRIVCQWRFQESAAAWHLNAAPVVSRWRFNR